MIYTLTTNPAVDMNVNADTLTTKKVNRTRDAVYTPNGKGLNVSFTLKHYGVDSVILGFFGGFSGNYIVTEAAKRCPVRPVQIDGITRVNIFVTTPEGEYKFPNAGAPVSREKQLEMLELLRGLDDLEVLVVSGSLSPEMDASYYDELIDVCQERGAEFVLDISHPHLAELVERHPLLIKPNDEELCQLFGVEGPLTALEAKEYAQQLQHMGARNVVVSLGAKGALLAQEGGPCLFCHSVRGEAVSTVGAGDSLVAGFLYGLGLHGTLEGGLKWGVAAGAATAFREGIATGDQVKAQFPAVGNPHVV